MLRKADDPTNNEEREGGKAVVFRLGRRAALQLILLAPLPLWLGWRAIRTKLRRGWILRADD